MEATGESKFTAMYSGSQASPSPLFGKSRLTVDALNKSNEYILEDENFNLLGDGSASELETNR